MRKNVRKIYDKTLRDVAPLTDIFHDEFGKGDAFHEVGRAEDDMTELRILEDMLLQEHGRRDVEPSADLREVAEEGGVCKFAVVFIHSLPFDVVFPIDFSPNAKHSNSIANFCPKNKGKRPFCPKDS